MFVLAKYNAGSYQLTRIGFSDMEKARAFIEQEKLPSFTWIVVDMTFTNMQRMAA